MSLISCSRRGAIGATLLATLALGLGVSPAVHAQATKNAANLAMIGEPQSLDPMVSSTDLVATIMQHVYEPLFTFDANWNVVPMLAEAMPVITDGGKTYTIKLRSGINLHNGRALTSEDVTASLQRWFETSARGKAVAQEVDAMTAKDGLTVEIKLKNAYAPLLAHLAMPSGMAAIMAKEAIATPLTSFVGTGPYSFKERRPDQYVLLSKFDKYSARSEPASGYGGKRQALIEELRFIPVPNANTRVEGALAGQFHFADLLPVEASSRLDQSGGKAVAIITPSFGFPYFVLNTTQGPLAKKEVRQAIQVALKEEEVLAAGFGDPKFYSVEANHFPKNTPFYSEEGKGDYNQGDVARAKKLAAEGGYKGFPIRILTSRQYEFHYNMALMIAEHLKRAGFAPELNVVDWATLVQRRGDGSRWDMYITHSGQFPEPMLSPPQLGKGAPGGWETATKNAALAAFNQESDPAKRGKLWGAVQKVVYDEVPYINAGRFNSLSARSPLLQGYVPATWPFFWNASIK